MSQEIKIKTFSGVQKFLRKIPNIHCGGCGVSALAMYRWLKKENLLQSTKFVFLYHNKTTYHNNSKEMETRSGTILAPSHCILLHDGRFVDATGNVDLKRWGPYVQIIDAEDFVEESLYDGDNWNECFIREDAIPYIEENLNIDLSDVM